MTKPDQDLIDVIERTTGSPFIIRLMKPGKKPLYLQHYYPESDARILTGSRTLAMRFTYRRDAQKYLELVYGKQKTT